MYAISDSARWLIGGRFKTVRPAMIVTKSTIQYAACPTSIEGSVFIPARVSAAVIPIRLHRRSRPSSRSRRSITTPLTHASSQPAVTITIIASRFGSIARNRAPIASNGSSKAVCQNGVMGASRVLPPRYEVRLFVLDAVAELIDALLRLGGRQRLRLQHERRGPPQIQRSER